VILVNPANIPVSGIVELFTSVGEIAERLNYTISAGSATTIQTNAASHSRTGWIRISSDIDTVSPSALAVLSFRPDSVTKYEVGVAAVAEESTLRIYAEASGEPAKPGSVESSFVVGNSTGIPSLIYVEVLALNGTFTGVHRYLNIPPASQIAMSLSEIPGWVNAHTPFKGFFRLSGPFLSAVGLRKLHREGGEVFVTSVPAISGSATLNSGGIEPPIY
jgi:hypothetical protein